MSKQSMLRRMSVVSLIFAGVFFALYHSNWFIEVALKVRQFDHKPSPGGWLASTIKVFAPVAHIAPAHQTEPFAFDCQLAGACEQNSDLSERLQKALRVVPIDDVAALLSALADARPGDLLLLQPGIYRFERYNILPDAAGTPDHPIVMAAETFGQVTFKMATLEGFVLSRPNWIMKNLRFEGACQTHSQCEHALHIVGNADNLILDNNQFVNFNAAIKANGDHHQYPARFAENVTIRYNSLFNRSPRNTPNPSTPLDIVGGDQWHIHHNFIADFTRSQASEQESIVYGMFLKGAGENGRVSNNVINCAWQIPHQSELDIRIGLSIGNGGTAPQFCQRERCAFEHKGARISGNRIYNCVNDVSIYLNKAAQTTVEGNILANSLGIDARFPASQVSITDNVMDGRVRSRNGAQVTSARNQPRD